MLSPMGRKSHPDTKRSWFSAARKLAAQKPPENLQFGQARGKNSQFGIPGIICKDHTIHLFSPSQGNVAFTTQMRLGAASPALPRRAAGAKPAERFRAVKQEIKPRATPGYNSETRTGEIAEAVGGF